VPSFVPSCASIRAEPNRFSDVAAPSYARRRPESSPLYKVVEQYLETFLAEARDKHDKPLPRYVLRYQTARAGALGIEDARGGGVSFPAEIRKRDSKLRGSVLYLRDRMRCADPPMFSTRARIR
jgi:hypothetical protein